MRLVCLRFTTPAALRDYNTLLEERTAMISETQELTRQVLRLLRSALSALFGFNPSRCCADRCNGAC